MTDRERASSGPADLAVIGGGPAGLAAAGRAAEAGLRVVLLDAGVRPGGQYFRHGPGDPPPGLAGLLARTEGVERLAEHRVWTIERTGHGFVVHALAGVRDERPAEIAAGALVLATGAYDRQLPFPGWDLPGVMTAGGAQALLKGSLVTPGRTVVVAGTGPFLFPVATGLAAAGARVAGVFEANRPGIHTAALGSGPSHAREGAGYLAALVRHGIRYRTGWAVVAAHADETGDALGSVTVTAVDRDWRPVPGTGRRIACDTLAVGYGFTPQAELALQVGCPTRTGLDGSLVVEVDAAQRTGVSGVFAAGETTGVGGNALARVEGEVAGYAAAGRTPPVSLLRRRRRLRAFARHLHAAYPVRPGWRDWLRDDTLVCRCEEVPYGRLAAASGLGATDPRTAKLLTRAGMGWCQGRVCGWAAACLGTSGPGAGPDSWPGSWPDAASLEALSRRTIATPITLAALANVPRHHPTETTPAGPSPGAPPEAPEDDGGSR
jgi:NADPH-dependent 2,4-dienoyl-CoA reductase/sulfur reductase-like enzyme